ncbi:MAG: hypothetical protein IT159_12840 [Bryobacterales bacterium]|nr:hypothetical protein [Bryobacterales bacterium]
MVDRRCLMLGAAALACALALAAALAAAEDVSGNWHFVLQTPGGEREADAAFKVNGEEVTGTFGDAEVKGTFKNGALELAFPLNSPEAGPGTMSIKGTLADGALSGSWEFAGYEGTFLAKRPQ